MPPAHPASPRATRVGFIGLGNVGGPMAGHVLRAGFPLVVHDRRAAAAAPLLDGGAAWADSPAELASRCDVICTCLPGPVEMEAVMLGAGGVREGAASGAVCADHTTNAPDVVRRVGAALADAGVQLLDAPLDGGREAALDGTLTLFVGGPETALERAGPVLGAFARRVVPVGELGAGSITKIAHNALAMSIDLLVAECLTLGARAGVAVPRLVEAFRAGGAVGGNAMFTRRMPATLFRGDFAPRFALALAYKDFRLAGALAAEHGVPARLLALCEQELLEAVNRGWGGADRLKASSLQEERAGVALRLSDPPS